MKKTLPVIGDRHKFAAPKFQSEGFECTEEPMNRIILVTQKNLFQFNVV